MSAKAVIRAAARWLAVGGVVAAGSYGAYAATTWARYGQPTPLVNAEERDALVDRFMPIFDVAERHHVRVRAPAEVTFQAATEMDLQRSPIIRGIFTAREWISGSHPAPDPKTHMFLSQMRAIGWGVLAELPGREIVMGAVAQPWRADVVFRALPSKDFAAFREPDYVKIVWTLRADPDGLVDSIFRTETRVATTDPVARTKFRRYWAFASPGIIVIRWASLSVLKTAAEGMSSDR